MTDKTPPSMERTRKADAGRRPSLETPEPIGPYRPLEKLGEGGMGEVWLAEQREPVRRKVALKVIKRGMDTKQVIARFEAERQALALMDHPAIARVYDAGETARGLPFFVMEYVRGVPITEHADRNKLGTRERLELFCQICEGVQHAHQKAILHRDLKPSNVLVSAQDGKALVKIIDFGLAKATAQRLSEKTMHTRFGALMGTPEYMSPEQAEMTGQDVDTRTDVYSLGVILYELLTGALPFEPQELHAAGFDALRRMIREDEPPRPSGRVSRLEEERGAASARNRKTERSKLVRRLKGDLDWIVMRCLEKDRSRRYGSPQEIAADVERHLADQPVLASPPSLPYRIGKFVRRNRVGVGAAAVVVAGLLVATVVASVGLVRARRAEAQARFEAQSSETVTTVLTDMLAELDPRAAGELLVRDVRERVEAHWRDQGRSNEEIASLLGGLDRALEGVSVTGTGLRILDELVLARSREPIEGQLAARPLIAARVEQTLASTYLRLGLYPQAERHQVRAVALRERELGREHPETLGSMKALGIVYADQGRFEEAERVLVEAVGSQGRVLGADNPDTLGTKNTLATVLIQQGRLDDAEPLLVAALEGRRHALGDDHLATLSSMNILGILYSMQSRPELAESLYLEALEHRRRRPGDEPPRIGTFALNLGMMYAEQGRSEEAEPFYREALESSRRALGTDHPATLNVMDELGGLYVELGRLDEAEPLLEAALEKRLEVLGEHNRYEVGFSYYHLGCLAAARSERDRALGYLGKARDLGWADPSILTDSSLDSLRGDPEFESIVAGVRERCPACKAQDSN